MRCSSCGHTPTDPWGALIVHTSRVVEWVLCIKCELKERGSDAVVFGSKQDNR